MVGFITRTRRNPQRCRRISFSTRFSSLTAAPSPCATCVDADVTKFCSGDPPRGGSVTERISQGCMSWR
jgi:hypothetical protein